VIIIILKLIDKLNNYPEVGVEAEFDQIKDLLDKMNRMKILN